METKQQGDTLYPDLSSLEGDNDILTALTDSKRKRPPRPPPPRQQSLPARAIDAILNDNGTDIPGVETLLPSCEGVESVGGQALKQDTDTVCVPPPLSAEKVRWFYQEPGKFWQPFSGPDSLAIEQCYCKTSSPGQEKGAGLVQVMGDLYEVNVAERTCFHIYWTSMGAWPILRGCWFEVLGDKWYPILEVEHLLIEAAHTDKTWREKVKNAEELVQWAESVSVGSKVSSASQTDGQSNKPNKHTGEEVVHRLALDKYEVMWMGNGEVLKLKKEISSQILNIVGNKLGKGGRYGCTKLVRGFKEEATNDDMLPPIGHIVFVIHGIGQSMDASCINASSTDFRTTCSQVAKKQFNDKWSHRRVEFIPVEWRTWLSLDKGVLDAITPHGVMKLRSMFNESVLDVLYYMSHKYGPEIRDGLRFALHKQYSEFVRRHPAFVSEGGTVSILAHSLGSVISYDLLLESKGGESAHRGNPQMRGETPSKTVELDDGLESVVVKIGISSPSPGAEETDSAQSESEAAVMRRELETLRARVTELEKKLGEAQSPPVQGLQFYVDHFFAVGSPLAVFLMMRDYELLIDPSHMSAASILPSSVCGRIHNVHHPSDPVAYRLEPLINPLYSQIKPVRIDSGSKISKEAVDHAEGTRTKPPPVQQSKGKSWFGSLALFAGSSSNSVVSKKSSPEPTRAKSAEKVADSDKHLKPQERLLERLDFMLKESFAESSYINSLTAHTGYWTSADCAQYVLLQLYNYKRDS